jgi:hypothetical protein
VPDLQHLTELIRSLAELKIKAAKIRQFEPDMFVDLVDRAIHEVGRQMRPKQDNGRRKSHFHR